MKHHELVIQVMETNGGFATLGYLYQQVFKLPGSNWKTKTPFASIRRIVQDKRYFFKIRPGLWALNTWKNRLPEGLLPEQNTARSHGDEYGHTYFQGLLVEIGNMEGHKTYVPAQDRNKTFLNKRLKDVASLSDLYAFAYPHILNKAKTVDVTWFNHRNMPAKMFEVEHSTNIQDSLLKFLELQDFMVEMRIVASKLRFREYQAKINLTAFVPIKNRVKFFGYEDVSNYHSKLSEYVACKNPL